MQLRRKKQEQKRFEEKLAIKQRMIDVATAQLIAASAQSDNREAKQAQEARAAEDAEMERRAERRRKQQAAIDRSRALQLKMKRDKKDAQKKADKQMALLYQRRNQQVEEETQAEELERIARNVKVRKALEHQVTAKRQEKMENRASALLAHRTMQEAMGEEGKRFGLIAQEEIKKAQAEGKNIIPIQRASAAKETDLMGAGGFRV